MPLHDQWGPMAPDNDDDHHPGKDAREYLRVPPRKRIEASTVGWWVVAVSILAATGIMLAR